jgi:Putative zinc-finger
MNDQLNLNRLPDHHEMSALIPWYVNSTLDERQRQRLQSHLMQCSACRADVELERRVHDSIAADTGVEYMPGPSLKRLQARLNALPGARGATDDSGIDEAVRVGPRAGSADPRKLRWTAIAASAVMIGLALGVVMIDRQLRLSAPRSYRTVTSPAPHVPEEVIRAVFAPTITLVNLQALLDEAQLRIVAGPTEAGVYSLAPTSDRPVPVALARLRKDPAVRFAESTLPRAPEP